MRVLTLKRAAGAISFAPDQEIELPDNVVQSLIDCGAVRSLEPVSKGKQEQMEEQKPQRKRKG
jgi:hypothetical protein